MTSASRRMITTAARDPSRSIAAPTLSDRPLSLPDVTRGFNTNVEVCASSVAMAAPPHAPLTFQPSPHPTDPPHAMDVAPSDTPSLNIGTMLAQQRIAAEIARLRVPPPSDRRPPRKPRTCRRCARPECPSKKSIKECKNPCQDCRKIGECNGRNPDRAKRPCHVAWIPL